MTRQEFQELKKGLQAIKDLTPENFQFTLEKHQTQRHGLRITSTFNVSHNAGDFANLILEEVLTEQEDAIIKAMAAKAREKLDEAKTELIAELDAELLKLKG